MRKVIIVSNCHECPFCNNDNEYGRNQCNLDDDIFTGDFHELPDDEVHYNCPLKLERVVVLAKY